MGHAIHGTPVEDIVTGEVICPCGVVLLEKSEISEDKYLADSTDVKNNTSHGARITDRFHDKGLTTVFSDKDATGKKLTGRMKSDFKRMESWNKRSRRYKNRVGLVNGLHVIETIKTQLNLSESIAEESAKIYRKALDIGLSKGRLIAEPATASVFFACRNAGYPKTHAELANVMDISKKNLARVIRQMKWEMNIEYNVIDPVTYLPKICSALKLNMKIQRLATRIIEMIKSNKHIEGKNPTAVASSAVYTSCKLLGYNIPQKLVADATGITEVTLRNRTNTPEYRQIVSDLTKELKFS